jgi:hypothetical protein
LIVVEGWEEGLRNGQAMMYTATERDVLVE